MGKNKIWKGLTELRNPERSRLLKEQEFSAETKEDFELSQLGGISRRKFLALSAATAAIATTACTNYRDKGSIVPYNQKPENVLPGKPNFYSSTCTGCANHCGILIKTREGRPIKVDGNPDHPVNKGKICAIGQASILNLYDPERVKKPIKKENGKSRELDWDSALAELVNQVRSAVSRNQEIALIAKPVFSPSTARLLEEFKKRFGTTTIYTYDFLESFAKLNAWKQIYPKSDLPEFDFSRAKIVVALESNFLATEGNFVKNIRQFVSNRNVDKPEEFNRLYAFEGDLSLTGANADYRFPLHPSLFPLLLATLINEILSKYSNRLLNNKFPKDKILGLVANQNLENFSGKSGINKSYLELLVKDLIDNQGKALIVTGDSLSEDVHLLAFLLNEILGNTKLYTAKPKPRFSNSSFDDFVQLSKKINAGQVGVIINVDCNPLFHFPEDLGLKQGFSKVPFVVTLTEDNNETAEASNLILPINHNFESWGDYYDGNNLYSTIQPVIEPIFGTFQKEDILLGLVNGQLRAGAFHKFLMDFWKKEIYPSSNFGVDFEQFWFSVLHDAVYIPPSNTVINSYEASFDFIEHKKLIAELTNDWTLVIKKPYFVGDGKYMNNGWLLELPHPITKVTWDNYAAISEKDAKNLKLENGSVVKLQRSGKEIEVPVFIVPGIAEKTIVIEAGFGREVVSVVGKDVGVNPIKLFGLDNSSNGYVFQDIKIIPTGKFRQIASTVEHHSLNDTGLKDLHKSRHIIQEGTLDEFVSGKMEIHRAKELISIIPEVKYTGVKWAMVIDLNKCVGCGACVTACNVENNVPIVGKDQVVRGREMQWIRIDTYFSGTPENPSVSLQPMLCQHCDDAPCENVCPVVATNHSPDGLNQMIYNRCVGTRYCSNNCPYKVRRFNFYDFRDRFADGYLYKDSLRLLNNPEVTVRSRGVMEKCTFCIQRIAEARQDALANGRQLKGTDVKTACQEACPAEAIIFGDMHDKDSELYYWRNHKLGYFVLEELNIKPNVTYIAKLRNKKSEEVA